MAGRVQIATSGELGDTLSINPSFSFFTKRYSKHTNHAVENSKITFPEKVFTGDFLDVPIPQNYGDILQNVTLSFSVDPSEMGQNFYPIDVFGISVIDYVELHVGEQIIDIVTADDIFIERELNTPESYRSSIDVLHGKHFQGSSDGEFLQEFYDGQYNTQGIDPFTTNEYRIQIPFYFHGRPAHGFPLCAVYKQELSLRIKLRPAIDVIFVTQEKFGGVTLWDPMANNQVLQQIELKDFKVNLDLIHLNTAERCMLRSKPMDILFEQRQRNEFMIEPQSKTGTFNLDFKNCVKELFFIAKKTGKWTDGDISILEKLHQLDQYTEAQKERLTLLKLIPVWGGLVTTALDSLVGEDDTDVRTAAIDAMLQAIYWGETTPFVGHLEDLKDPPINANDLVVQTEHINDLKTYISGIPSQIITSQINATSNLNALIGKDSEIERIDIIDNNLLTIPNFWGEEQVGILQLLKFPRLPQEELLIFGLRAYLTTASYYLSGLSELKPGATDQVATVTKLIEFLDNTKTEFDIIKLGLKAVLDSIPGKSEYLRARIVGALLKLGATLWYQETETEIDLVDQLKSLLINPGNDTTIINSQAVTITTLKAYLDGVYNQLSGVKKFVHENLNILHGETNEDTRESIVNGLREITRKIIVNGSLEIVEFWTPTEKGHLDNLKDPQVDNEAGLILALRVYTDAQESGILDGVYTQLGGVKKFVHENLNTLHGETNEDTRESIVNGLLGITRESIVNGSLEIVEFWTPTEKGHLDNLKDPQVDNEAGLILALRVYTDAQISGIKEIVDTELTALAGQENGPTRVVIVGGLLAIPDFWTAKEEGYLNDLKDPQVVDEAGLILALRVYTNAKVTGVQLINEGMLDVINDITSSNVIVNQALDNLDGEENEITRKSIVDSIVAIPNYWTANEFNVLHALKTYDPSNEVTHIPVIRTYADNKQASTPTPTIEERIASVEVLRQTPIWGDDIIKLVLDYDGNPAYTPILTGYLTGILGAIPTLKYRLNALKGGINGVLDTLPTTSAEDRDPIMLGIATSYAWSDEAFSNINALRTPSGNDEDSIAALKQKGIEEGVPNMTGYTQFDQNNVIDGIISLNLWGEKYSNLNDLRQITPGSEDHGADVDLITTYLDSLYNTITGLLGGLLQGSATTLNLTNTSDKIAAWGGYFYDLLEDLKSTSPSDETGIITKLTTYVNNTSLSETRNTNLKFLISQLTVAYPESIFNKWVRAKKNVPLMYSKQKTTTLDCDGTQILDKTTGSNMFLSASLPNLYHKRSPNFRNINMYSFALYPDELRPSGHLNFSTIKDARVTMELEYDGRHGTFDFDDNYIEVFGIEPIYFPKQVIIIAKSYNMMIIRNGEARIIY